MLTQVSVTKKQQEASAKTENLKIRVTRLKRGMPANASPSRKQKAEGAARKQACRAGTNRMVCPSLSPVSTNLKERDVSGLFLVAVPRTPAGFPTSAGLGRGGASAGGAGRGARLPGGSQDSSLDRKCSRDAGAGCLRSLLSSAPLGAQKEGATRLSRWPSAPGDPQPRRTRSKHESAISFPPCRAR